MDVRLVTDPRDLEGLPDGTALAVDTEFHAEKRYTPQLHLVQVLADLPDAPVWLLDAHVPGLLASCADALTRQPWVVHAGSHDIPLLQRALGRVPDVIWDTQIADGLVRPVWPAGLGRLAAHWLGATLDKGETLSDWSRRPLTPAQLAYAAGDVRLLHPLRARLAAEVDRRGRTELVAEACLESTRTALDGQDPESAWRNVPGHASLPGPSRCVLQELASWREGIARSEDQPPPAILSNRALLDLAKRLPLDGRTLVAGRRAPRSALARYEAALLECVDRASRRPEFGWPAVVEPGTRAASRLAWLRAWGEQEGQREGWSPRLVIPDALAEAWALGSPLERTWRSPLLSPVLTGPPAPLPCPPGIAT